MRDDPAEAGKTAPRSHAQSAPGIVSDVLLRRLADLLTARGMEIRKYEHGKEIVEVVVVNPRDPERGRAVIGYDGLLTWECRSALKIDSDVDLIADMIFALLTKNVTSYVPRAPICEGDRGGASDNH